MSGVIVDNIVEQRRDLAARDRGWEVERMQMENTITGLQSSLRVKAEGKRGRSKFGLAEGERKDRGGRIGEAGGNR